MKEAAVLQAVVQKLEEKEATLSESALHKHRSTRVHSSFCLVGLQKQRRGGVIGTCHKLSSAEGETQFS